MIVCDICGEKIENTVYTINIEERKELVEFEIVHVCKSCRDKIESLLKMMERKGRVFADEGMDKKRNEENLEDIEFQTVHLTLPKEMMNKVCEIVDEGGFGYLDFEEFIREAVRNRILNLETLEGGE